MHKDIAGNEIKVGDFIFYATRAGSSVYMKFGRVQELLNVKTWRAEPVPKIRIMAVLVGWSEDSFVKQSKPSLLTEFRRALVIPESSLPAKVRDLLAVPK